MQKNQLLFIVSLVFAIIVTLFALINANPVVINFYFYKIEASLALIILLSAILGAIIVTTLGIASHFRFKNEIKRLSKDKEELTQKNQDLLADIEKMKEIDAHKKANQIDNKESDDMNQ